MEIIRKTKSVCPVCLSNINAKVIRENNKVFMIKECSKHGRFKVLLSNDAKYYNDIRNLFDSFCFRKDIKNFMRNYFNFYLTPKCNLNCRICMSNANSHKNEPSIKMIWDILQTMKGIKIGLWGGEPTMRNDLPEIIKLVKKSKNIPALYTNGIKISDYNYLKLLKKNGLEIVHIQFDGFDDHVYKILRGRALAQTKIKALNNLKRLKIPTVLEVTIARKINENEIQNIFNFAVRNKFVTAVLFRSYSHLVRRGLKKSNEILSEELIGFLDKGTKGRISKRKILEFQEVLYAAYNLFSIIRCFYNQYFLIKREEHGYKTIDEIINIQKTRKKIKRYLNIKNEIVAQTYLYYLFTNLVINKEIITSAFSWLRIFIEKKLFNQSFTSSALSTNFLIIGIGYVCNSYNYEEESKRVCVGGEILPNGQIMPSLVESNLLREKELLNNS